METPMIDLVPLVREFSDVFPTNLLGIPPNRDIDFDIDLVWDTRPISIPPYRTAPIELRELKEKLLEFLKKWFFRLRVPPYDALMLFVKTKDGSMWMRIDYRRLNKVIINI